MVNDHARSLRESLEARRERRGHVRRLAAALRPYGEKLAPFEHEHQDGEGGAMRLEHEREEVPQVTPPGAMPAPQRAATPDPAAAPRIPRVAPAKPVPGDGSERLREQLFGVREDIFESLQ